MDPLDFYLNQYQGTLDKYFGIQEYEGHYYLGSKRIEIDGNDIVTEDGIIFAGTTGLWALIMENRPDMNNITEDVLNTYRGLMTATEAYDYGIQNPGSRNTKKKKLLERLKMGDGISFLPSDINSLHQELKVLLVEYKAGNRAARNEIVAIVDNLLGRKQMKKSEALDINNPIMGGLMQICMRYGNFNF